MLRRWFTHQASWPSVHKPCRISAKGGRATGRTVKPFIPAIQRTIFSTGEDGISSISRLYGAESVGQLVDADIAKGNRLHTPITNRFYTPPAAADFPLVRWKFFSEAGGIIPLATLSAMPLLRCPATHTTYFRCPDVQTAF